MKTNTTYFSEMFGKFVIMMSTFFAPTFALFAIVGIAILADTIAGRWCAIHKAKKEGLPIREVVTSKKTRKGVIQKAIGYGLAVLLVFLLDKVMMNEVSSSYLPFEFISTKLVTLFLVWLEFDSIDEKYYHVKGVRITDKIKSFFRGIKNFIGELLDIRDRKNK